MQTQWESKWECERAEAGKQRARDQAFSMLPFHRVEIVPLAFERLLDKAQLVKPFKDGSVSFSHSSGDW